LKNSRRWWKYGICWMTRCKSNLCVGAQDSETAEGKDVDGDKDSKTADEHRKIKAIKMKVA